MAKRALHRMAFAGTVPLLARIPSPVTEPRTGRNVPADAGAARRGTLNLSSGAHARDPLANPPYRASLAENGFRRVDDAHGRILPAIGTELLGVLDEHVGVASSESPLYQPSIQVSTILIVSSPPSTNCLHVMVDRSRTTACAGADDSASAAANRIEAVVFMMSSIGA